jgi:hypothetical protein
MARDINFVAQRRKKLTAQQLQDKKFFGYAVGVVSVVFTIFVLVAGVRLFAVYQVKKIKDAQEAARMAILSQEQVEKEFNIFAHKLRALSDLFGKRQDKQKAMVFFSEIFGPTIIISEIDYSADDDDIVTFTLTAPSIFDLETVFSILDSPSVTDTYTSIHKSSLVRSSEGLYNVKLTVALGTTAE